MPDAGRDANVANHYDNLTNDLVQKNYDAFKNEFNQMTPEAQLASVKQITSPYSQYEAAISNNPDKHLPQVTFDSADSQKADDVNIVDPFDSHKTQIWSAEKAPATQDAAPKASPAEQFAKSINVFDAIEDLWSKK